MIKVGTRVRTKDSCLFPERISGRIFTVTASDDIGIAIKSCDHGPESVYRLTEGAFSDYFEVIGMEESKKQSDDEVINLSITEAELYALWAKSASFEYFKTKLKRIAEGKDKMPKGERKWTPWTLHPLTGFVYSVSYPAGKSAKVKVNSCGFVGIASCNPEDVWDLDVGIELAAARAEVKRTKAEVLKKKDLFREALKNRAEAVNSLDAITGRIYRKAAK